MTVKYAQNATFHSKLKAALSICLRSADEFLDSSQVSQLIIQKLQLLIPYIYRFYTNLEGFTQFGAALHYSRR